MRNFIFAAIAVAGLIGNTAAIADDFSGQTENPSVMALDHQAVDSESADPTAAGSLRSHGRP